MKAPLQITFRNMEPLPVVEEWIRKDAEKLETFYESIMRIHVAIEMPHRHRGKGVPYNVRLDIRVPGGEMVVNRESNPAKQARQAGRTELKKSMEIATPRKDLRATIDEAFKLAGRRLQDYARRQSGYVKTRELPSSAQVTMLQPDKGYGFLTADDGREIYFHEQSVLNHGFSRLRIGTPVTFAEEQGTKGPQASTVRIVGKTGSRRPMAMETVAAM